MRLQFWRCGMGKELLHCHFSLVNSGQTVSTYKGPIYGLNRPVLKLIVFDRIVSEKNNKKTWIWTYNERNSLTSKHEKPLIFQDKDKNILIIICLFTRKYWMSTLHTFPFKDVKIYIDHVWLPFALIPFAMMDHKKGKDLQSLYSEKKIQMLEDWEGNWWDYKSL